MKARMEQQSQQLSEGLFLCRREGEVPMAAFCTQHPIGLLCQEMVATMKDNDRNIAEMRAILRSPIQQVF